MRIILLLLIFSTTTFAQENNEVSKKVGIENNQLFPCTSKPNCVNSMASRGNKEHYVAPLIIDKTRKDIIEIAAEVLKKWKRTTIIEQTNSYLHAEVKSALFGFVDDLEVYLPSGSDQLHFKSASRVGYSDLGVNRKRVEQLKKEMLLKF